MTRTEVNLLTMAVVVVIYVALVAGLIAYVGPDIFAIFGPS